MTGVREKLDEYAGFVADEATSNFRPTNVVSIPGVSDERARGMISSTMESMEKAQAKALRRQYGAAFDAVGDEVENHADEFIENDAFYRNYEGERDDEFRDALVERLRETRDALAPVVESEKDEFWDAVREAYDREEAVEQLGKLFTATETAERFSEGIAMEIEVPVRSKNYTYTDESLRAFGVAEEKAREKAEREAEDVF
ncbi:MAG: hypothetical protein U5J64_05210 [Halobacteriales archaeon]|nr:hypothetical protein [Halobacteriales archaeon]